MYGDAQDPISKLATRSTYRLQRHRLHNSTAASARGVNPSQWILKERVCALVEGMRNIHRIKLFPVLFKVEEGCQGADHLASVPLHLSAGPKASHNNGYMVIAEANVWSLGDG